MIPGLGLVAVGVKYGKMASQDITSEIVSEVAAALGISPSPTAIEATTVLVKSGGEEAISQWLKNPANITKIQETLAGPTDEEEILGRCPHCKNLIAFSAKTLQ